MDQALVRSDSGFQSLDSSYLSPENTKLMTYNKAQMGTKLPNFDVLLLRDSQIQTLDCDIQQMKHSQYETQRDIRDIHQRLNQLSRCISGTEKMLRVLMETNFMTKILPIYESKSGKIPVEAETSCKITAEDEMEFDEICPEDVAKDRLKLRSSQTVNSQYVVGRPCFPPHRTIENSQTEVVKPLNSFHSKSEKKEGFASEMPVADVSPNEPDNGAQTITEDPNIVRYEDLYNLAPCSSNEPTGTAGAEQDALCLAGGCIPRDFVDIKSDFKMPKIPGNPDGKMQLMKKDVDASCNGDTPKRENCDNNVFDSTVKKRQIEDSIGDPDKYGDSEMNNTSGSNFVNMKRRRKVEVGDGKKQKINQKEKEFNKSIKIYEEICKYRKKKMLKEKKMNMMEKKRLEKRSKNTQTATKFSHKPFLNDGKFMRKTSKLKDSELLSFSQKQKDAHDRFSVKHRKGHGTRKRRRRYGKTHEDTIKKPYGNRKETNLRNGGLSGGIATNVCYPYGTKDYLLLMFLFLALTGVAVASDKNRKSEEKHCSSQYENGFLIYISIGLPEWFFIFPDTIAACCMVNLHDITTMLFDAAGDCSIFMVITLMINVAVFWIINHLKTSNCDVTILHQGEIICRRFLSDDMQIKLLITQIEQEKLVKEDFYMRTDSVPVLFQGWSMMRIAKKENSRSFTVEIKDTV